MSDAAQLKRKRSQREKAPATTLPKRQKSDHLEADTETITPKPVKTQSPKVTPKAQTGTATILPQSATTDSAQALQVAKAPGEKKKSRRSRARHGDHLAVDKAHVSEKPLPQVEGKPKWSLSKPLGGRLIAQDPVFAQDERYANPRLFLLFKS